jgi:hypothetical protein
MNKDTIKTIKRVSRLSVMGANLKTRVVPNKRKDSHKSRRAWKNQSEY